MRIDAHQHFWNYHPQTHSWIDEHMQVIRKNFLPSDLEPLIQSSGIDATVAVQADESDAETEMLLRLADQYPFIAGVVGWINLKQVDVETNLAKWMPEKHLKGFRSIMQGTSNEAYLTNSLFINNVKKLSQFNFTYDLLVYHDQLPALIHFTEQLPDNKLILDHLGKPAIAKKEFKAWREQIKELSKHPKLYCKISGMITEADHLNWSTNDLLPYMETVAEFFGTNRICFGSDWPVCLLAGSYQRVIDAVEQFATQLTKEEQNKLFGQNTKEFYNLSIG